MFGTVLQAAYLVLWVGIEKPWPELLGAGIYSEDHPSCFLGRQRSVPILQATGPTFEDAKRLIVDQARSGNQEWLRTLLDKGMPGWDKPNSMIGQTLVGQMP